MIAATELHPRSRRGGSVLKLHANGKNVKFQTLPTEEETPAFPRRSAIWHGNCHITRARSGVAAHLPVSTGRGGARNRADRVSEALTLAQAENLKAAAVHAKLIGLPMNRMITLHWQSAGISLAGMAKATGRYLDYLSKALARHNARTAWLWTHENCDAENKGGHAHLLVHVRPDLVPKIANLQKRWLRRITGQPYRTGVVHSVPIGGRLGLERGNPELHAVNLETALSYVLKGADAAAAAQLALARLEPGGMVIGKRCGTSQNIAGKARQNWNLDD